MTVVLELLGHLPWYAPGGVKELSVEVPAGTTVIQAVRLAKLPFGEVAFATVDGAEVDLEAPVEDGWRVTLMSAICGG